MTNKEEQRHKTYDNLNNWQNFRLRLFGEGILVGIFAGCIVGFFRYVLHYLEAERFRIFAFLSAQGPLYLVGWLLILLIAAGILAALVAYEPLSGGSGIPQVKGNILGYFKTKWWRIIIAKLAGGIIGIGSGLSLGREGPSIQLGAMAAQGISRAMKRTRMEERYLISSGAGAGLAAAFNAPLAGVIFTLEELNKNFSMVVMLPSMAAAMTATIISHVFFGQKPIFTFNDISVLPVQYLPCLALVGICMGIFGAFFNSALLKAGDFYKSRFFKNNFMRIALPLLISVPLGFYLPEVLGGGNDLVDSLVKQSFSMQFLLLLLFGKFVFTMLSYGSGVPGGFFLPMLVIGALGGNVLASGLISIGVLEPAYRIHMLIYAMTGFFAASVRAPITGMILIMEMTASFEHLAALGVVAMCAFVAAELCHSRPIYDSLLDRAMAGRQTVPENSERSVIELAVVSGCAVDGRKIKDITWPEHTLLVDVKRGEDDLVPSGDTRLMAGDYLFVLTDNANASDVRELIEK